MSVLVADPDLTIHVGDALEVLATLPAESVDLVATSPPFFGLRDYGTGTWEGGDEGCDHLVPLGDGGSGDAAPGYESPFRAGKQYTHQKVAGNLCKCGARRVDRQIGLEETPEAWAAALVAVFAECRRVLRPAGSMFVECGDSYNSGTGVSRKGHSINAQHGRWENGDLAQRVDVDGLKPKDLLGQPFLLAFALRADGWYWRGCYPWAKPNAMPESAKDRCTTAHSFVLHFAKNSRYFFDGDSIAEPAAWERWGDQTVPKYEGTDTASGWMQPKTKGELARIARAEGTWESGGLTNGRSTTPDGRSVGRHSDNASKHPRSVWTIPTQGFAGAHFATWPEALARRIILAGCPERVCGTCGKARERIVERGGLVGQDRGGNYNGREIDAGVKRNPGTPGMAYETETVGWSDCGHDNYQPGTILDPFGGSGTTGLVARKHGRRAVLIELNPEYARLAAERCQQLSLLAGVSA